MYEELLQENFRIMSERYDPAECLVLEWIEKEENGSLEGYVHSTRDSAAYIGLIYAIGDETYYGRARDILSRLIGLQDLRADSDTFGVWSYWLEEPIDDMETPDENWAVFIGKIFAYVLKYHSQDFDCELTNAIKHSISASAECVLKCNISADYTNISIMSTVFMLAAGEILPNNHYMTLGRQMMKRITEYNVFNGNFSEYNSSTYSLLALEDLAFMTLLVEDTECRQMADKLNYIGWKTLAEHYHTTMMQLAPPQMRAYLDLDNGSLRIFIYIGTDGKYGKLLPYLFVPDTWYRFPIRCPKELYPIFEMSERWFETVYYKKNVLRSPEENTIIIRDRNSPDLLAFTYIAPEYAMGAFEKTDLWNQRRTSMVVWGGDKPSFVRLRCLKNNYDYCSGMAFTAQHKNVFVTNLGFATDRGDVHYILDRVKDGKLSAESLLFRFEFGGVVEDLQVVKESNKFMFVVNGLRLELTVFVAMFDGKAMDVFFDEDNKCIDFVCFNKATEVDFHALKKCYVSFSLAVNCTISEGTAEIFNDMVRTCVTAGDCTLKVSSPVDPVPYDTAIETVKTERIVME